MKKNVLELPLRKQFKLARKTKNQNYIAVFELSTSEPVLSQLALNPHTPGVILDTLALRGSVLIKGCVLANARHLKKKTWLRLRDDEDALIRNMASLVHWHEN